MLRTNKTNPKAAWEFYVYPGTDILINNLIGSADKTPEITKEKVLKAQTAIDRITALRQNVIMNEITSSDDSKNDFSFDAFKLIHNRIFAKIYDWAGQERICTSAKNFSSFVSPENIEKYADRIFSRIQNKLINQEKLTKQDFVNRFSECFADLNSLHPFREGNGRTIRMFMFQVAKHCGYTFDFKKIVESKNDATNSSGFTQPSTAQLLWNSACMQAMPKKDGREGDLTALKVMFTKALRIPRAYSFENESMETALRKHPELKGAYATLDSFIHKSLVGGASIGTMHQKSNEQRMLDQKKARQEIIRQLDTGKIFSDNTVKKSIHQHSISISFA